MGQKDKKNRYDFAKANFASLIARALLDKKMPGNAVAELKATGFEAASEALEKLRTTPDDQAAQSAVFDAFAALIDPTLERKTGNCKFLHWACKKWLEAPTKIEDIYKLKDNLAYFEKLSRKLHQDGARNQIKQINSFADLAEVLEPYQRERARRKAEKQTRRMSEEDKASLDAETTTIYDGPEGKVVMPHTIWASQFWGNQTKWCIAAAKDGQNRFDHYNKKHPVIIYLPKPTAKDFALCGAEYDSFKFAAVGDHIYNEHDQANPKTMTPCMQKLAQAAQNKWAGTPQADYLNTHGHAQEITELPEGRPDGTTFNNNGPDIPPIKQYPNAWQPHMYGILDDMRSQGEITSLRDYLPTSLLDDPDFMLALAQQSKDLVPSEAKLLTGNIMRCASYRLHQDKAFILAMTESSGHTLQFASAEMRADKDIVTAAVQNDGHALEYASEDLRDNKDVVMVAVQHYGWSLKHASNRLRNDKEVVLCASQKYTGAIAQASDKLRDDKEVAMAAVQRDGGALRFVSDRLRNDKEVAIAAVQQYGRGLEGASEDLRNDRNVVMTAIEKDPSALAYASEKLRDDKDIVMAAIQKNVMALQYASDRLQNSREIVMTAVQCHGVVPEYASLEFRKILYTLQKSPKRLQQAAEKNTPYQDNPEHMVLAGGQGLSPHLVSKELLEDPTYIRRTLEIAQENGNDANALPHLRHTKCNWGDFAAVTSVEGALAKLDASTSRPAVKQRARPAI